MDDAVAGAAWIIGGAILFGSLIIAASIETAQKKIVDAIWRGPRKDHLS